MLHSSGLPTRKNKENTERVYWNGRRAYGERRWLNMPSHRKTKRKKKGAMKGRSSNARPPGDTSSTTGTKETEKKTILKRDKKTTRPAVRTKAPRIHNMDGRNFFVHNELMGMEEYFYPDLTSPHNNLSTKFINGSCRGLYGFECAVESLIWNLGIDEMTIPLRRLKKVAGGYLIDAHYIDTIESYHEIWIGKLSPPQYRKAPQETHRIELKGVNVLIEHLRQRTKTKKEGLLRDRIRRRIRFREAHTELENKLPKITTVRQQRRAQWAKTRDELERKLKRRNYSKILKIAIIAILRDQNEKTRRIYIRLQSKRKSPKWPTRQRKWGKQPQRRNPGQATTAGVSLLCHWHIPPWAACTTSGNDGATRTRGALLN